MAGKDLSEAASSHRAVLSMGMACPVQKHKRSSGKKRREALVHLSLEEV
jgi:hypothetical protein